MRDIKSPTVRSRMTSFEPATADEVRKIIINSPRKTCDLDPIPTELLKSCLDVLLVSITQMVYLSLISGVFLDTFKTSHVMPLLKKPSLSKDDMKNYRPVSNLNFVSKITAWKRRSIKSVSVSLQEISFHWNGLTQSWKWHYFEYGWGKGHCTYSVRSVCCFRHSGPQQYHQSLVNLVWYRWYRPWLVCVLLVRS